MTYKTVRTGHFLSRPNRFIAHIEIDGKEEICHVKNTGRCKELLVPGATVYLQDWGKNCIGRKTRYDLIAVDGEKILKISVKGSQDGGWGLTQNFKKGRTYREAAEEWLKKHHKKTIFCLVQFKNVDDSQMPRMYLASPEA